MGDKRDKKQITISETDQRTMKLIGDRVKELRREKSSNHETFAYENDINRISLYRLENGKGNFTINTLLKVLRGLDVSPEEFFKGIK